MYFCHCSWDLLLFLVHGRSLCNQDIPLGKWGSYQFNFPILHYQELSFFFRPWFIPWLDLFTFRALYDRLSSLISLFAHDGAVLFSYWLGFYRTRTTIIHQNLSSYVFLHWCCAAYTRWCKGVSACLLFHAVADTQGETVLAEMEQAMTGLMDLSYKKVEPPKLPCHFATKWSSSDVSAGVSDSWDFWFSFLSYSGSPRFRASFLLLLVCWIVW
jgi:hypothetical protein